MAVGQIIRQLFAFYRQRRIRRIGKAIVVVGGITGLLFLETIGFFLSVEANVLILVALAFVSLELIETKLYDIEDQVRTEDQSQLYETPRQAYSRLAEFIGSEPSGPSEVYLISYYGRMDIRELITTAVNNDFHVNLLLKYPSTLDDSTAIDDDEINEQVGAFIEQVLPPALYDEYENLSIRFYRFPACVNAVKVSDEGIGVGWYVISSSDGQPRAQGTEKDSPMFVYTQGAPNYEPVDQWFRGVFTDLWKSAATLEEVYEQGSSERINSHIDHKPERRKEVMNDMSPDLDEAESTSDIFGT